MKLREIAEALGASLSGDPDLQITGVASLEEGKPSDICLYLGGKFKKALADTRCRALVVPPGAAPEGFSLLTVERPRLRFIEVINLFHAPEKRRGIHPAAIVSPAASLGAGVFVGAHACIGEGASVGDRTEIHENAVVYRDVRVGAECLIYAGAVLREGTVIGDRCIIHAGAVLGADGFGFEADAEGTFRKIPQVGRVVLEDDVEIGANTCIDRAALGETRVGRGTKIDNLCQLGHGVRVGSDTVISGMTGISGSAKIGSHVLIGGGVGIGDHLTIGDGVRMAGRTGVTGDVPAGSVIAGLPHTDLRTWKRASAILYRLAKREKGEGPEEG